MFSDKCDKLQGVFPPLKGNKKVPLNPDPVLKNMEDIRLMTIQYCQAVHFFIIFKEINF